jgi:site-specific DNA recombinase
MTPAHTTKKGQRMYRYYVCCSAQKRGWKTCPSKSVPAQQVEDLVVNQIRAVGSDPLVLGRVLAEARARDEARTAELEGEERGLAKDLASWNKEVHSLTAQIKPGEDNGSVISRLADLHERIGTVEGRVKQVRAQVQAIHGQIVDADEAQLALSAFDPVWGTLTPREQSRVVGLLVERVDYDGAKGKVAIAFHPSGIRTLARELADKQEERSA